MLNPENTYIMVATVERDVTGISVHDTKQDAVKAANDALLKRMEDLGLDMNDSDILGDAGTHWEWADDKNCLAYCDYEENFDAHVLLLGDFMANETIRPVMDCIENAVTRSGFDLKDRNDSAGEIIVRDKENDNDFAIHVTQIE